ncbi:uncharacterized protein LOC127464968 [Manacus candei]|uniref:uncharacterized protein LOC127464968 n=1 Tax=Manacus candei TaxID=415023 RepID=UPI002227C7A2|nr:uncharacterized protein LOC127464968 [Manacus candei]
MPLPALCPAVPRNVSPGRWELLPSPPQCCPHPLSAALGRGAGLGKSANRNWLCPRGRGGAAPAVPGKTSSGILPRAVPGKSSSGILLCAVPGKSSSGILPRAVPVLLLLLLLCQRNPALASCSVLVLFLLLLLCWCCSCCARGTWLWPPALCQCSVPVLLICSCCARGNWLWHELCSVPAFCAGAAPAAPSVPGETGCAIVLCAGALCCASVLCWCCSCCARGNRLWPPALCCASAAPAAPAVPGETGSGLLLCASVPCQRCSSAAAVPGENCPWHELYSVPVFCAGAAPAAPSVPGHSGSAIPLRAVPPFRAMPVFCAGAVPAVPGQSGSAPCWCSVLCRALRCASLALPGARLMQHSRFVQHSRIVQHSQLVQHSGFMQHSGLL